MSLEERIDAFLSEAKPNEYWRAIELHEQLIGPGDEHIMDVKRILEVGVDGGKYERLITTKKKVVLVGYRLKRREEQTITEKDVGKVSDVLGWERSEPR